MSTLLFPAYGIDGNNIQLITDIFYDIKATESAAFDIDYTFDFRDFELFNYYVINLFGPAIIINKESNPIHLAFINVYYKINSANKCSNPTYSDFQTWGIISLKENYGHILIKPETFLDKIHDLINPIELDFKDDEEFSKKFYVVTNDKLKTELLITQTFRDCIQKLEVSDFLIEIIGDKLIVGNKKVIEPDSAIAFMKFLKEVSKYF